MPALPLADFEKLIKFMGMTGSSADGEALNAMRLANNMLMRSNLSWEEILRGKVTVQNIQAAAGAQPAGSTVPKGAAKRTPDVEVDEVIEHLQATVRPGGFRDFVDGLAKQWEDEGWLSTKQWDALKRSFDRSGQRSNASNWQSV